MPHPLGQEFFLLFLGRLQLLGHVLKLVVDILDRKQVLFQLVDSALFGALARVVPTPNDASECGGVRSNP